MKINKNDQIVILAGGFAKRLGNLTKTKPKSLLEFNKKPFIFYQLEHFQNNGFENVLILIGHKGEKIKKAIMKHKFMSLKIKFNYDGKKNLGTGGALKKAKKKLHDNFFLVYGDTYPQTNFSQLKKHHSKKRSKYTIIISKNKDKLDKNNILISKKKVIYYDKTLKDATHIDYGVSLINKNIFNKIKKKSFDLGIVTKLAIKYKILNYLIEKKKFYEIGSYKGLNQFKKFLKN